MRSAASTCATPDRRSGGSCVSWVRAPCCFSGRAGVWSSLSCVRHLSDSMRAQTKRLALLPARTFAGIQDRQGMRRQCDAAPAGLRCPACVIRLVRCVPSLETRLCFPRAQGTDAKAESAGTRRRTLWSSLNTTVFVVLRVPFDHHALDRSCAYGLAVARQKTHQCTDARERWDPASPTRTQAVICGRLLPICTLVPRRWRCPACVMCSAPMLVV